MQQRRQPVNGSGGGEARQEEQSQSQPQDAAEKKDATSKAPRRGCYFSLAFSIGSMGLACGSLWQIPNSSDRISLQRGLVLTSLGFIYFVSLTDFCNKYWYK